MGGINKTWPVQETGWVADGTAMTGSHMFECVVFLFH